METIELKKDISKIIYSINDEKLLNAIRILLYSQVSKSTELPKINDRDIEFVSDKEQQEIEKELNHPDCYIIAETETVEI